MSQARAAETIREFLAFQAANTRTEYERDLGDFARFAKTATAAEAIGAVLGADGAAAELLVRRYVRSMTGGRRGLSSSTVNRRLSVLRQIFQKARSRGLVTWSLDLANVPAEAAKDNAGPAREQVVRVLERLRDRTDPASRRAYLIVRLGVELALRRKEICGLELSDLDLPGKRLRVLGKGRKEKQWLEYTAATAAAFERWLAVRPGRPYGPVFVNLIPGRHERLTGSAVYEIVRQAGAASKVKMRPHGLRHTGITEAVKGAAAANLTLDQVADFSRHKDLRMVLRYRDREAGVQRKLATIVGQALG